MPWLNSHGWSYGIHRVCCACQSNFHLCSIHICKWYIYRHNSQKPDTQWMLFDTPLFHIAIGSFVYSTCFEWFAAAPQTNGIQPLLHFSHWISKALFDFQFSDISNTRAIRIISILKCFCCESSWILILMLRFRYFGILLLWTVLCQNLYSIFMLLVSLKFSMEIFLEFSTIYCSSFDE